MKVAVIVLAGAETREGRGRVVNALTTVKELREAGDEAVLVFDGAGTTWIPVLAKDDDRYHELFLAVRESISGACAYCARAYGVADEVEQAGFGLVDEYDSHPSIRGYLAGGFEVLTF